MQLTKLCDWREQLLRVAFTWSGLLNLVGASVYSLVSERPQIVLSALATAVGVAHLLTRVVVGRHQLRSILFLASVYLEMAVFGAQYAWSPTVLLIALFGTIYSGLLLGRLGAIAFPAGSMVLLLTGGWAVKSGWSIDAAFLDLSIPRGWLRSGAMVTSLTAMMALSLRLVLRLLTGAQQQAARTLNETEREAVLLQSARSSRVATERALLDSQKLQTVALLSGGLAHLLNNALTVVRDAAEQLTQSRSKEGVRQIALNVTESVLHAAETTRNLLLFSRHDQPETQALSIDAQIEALVGTIKEALPGNIKLVTHLDSTCAILADPQRIRQLILNLVVNAREAMAAGGTLTVRTKQVSLVSRKIALDVDSLPPGDYAVLTVMDDGTGMPKHVATQACEPFFTTKDPVQHDGLGLFVAFGLVKQWGGSLNIETQEARGTEVIVQLPMTASSSAPSFVSNGPSFHRVTSATAPPTPTAVATDDNFDPRQFTPAPVANPAGDTQAWKDRSLQRALIMSNVVAAFTCVGDLFLSNVIDRVSVVGSLCAFAVTLAAACLRPLGMRVRLGALLLGITTVAGEVILHNGYMSPVAVAGLAITPILAAVFSTPFTMVLTLLCNALVFVVGAHGPVAGTWNVGNVDPTVARNWFRVAIVVPIAYGFASRLVLDVFETAIGTVRHLEASIESLLATRGERLAETRSLTAAQLVAERATRLETAGRAVGMIAHDLNNSLGAVLGWASLLLEDPDSSKEDVDTAVAVFRESADFAETLVLQLEHQPRGTRADAYATDLAVVCNRFLNVLKRLARNNVDIALAVEPGCFAPLTEHDLRRILLNLATNARDAMPNGGTFTIRCFGMPGTREVCLQLSDTGIGMNEDVRAHLFDAFFTTKGIDSGTGLGLHTVREIVTTSGGKIEVSSQPNQGACFTLRWPIASQPKEHSIDPSSTRGRSRGLILLAEDNDHVRNALGRGLLSAGYDVVTAADGDEARQRLDERSDWSALCTDAIMPGYATTKLIQDFRVRCPSGHVVVCSGHLPKDVDDIVQAGEVEFLPKPFPSSALVAALNRVRR